MKNLLMKDFLSKTEGFRNAVPKKVHPFSENAWICYVKIGHPIGNKFWAELQVSFLLNCSITLFDLRSFLILFQIRNI